MPLAVAALGTGSTEVEALAAVADGMVAMLPGAGHAPPPVLRALASAAERLPVVITVRPERGSLLRGTYGFVGAEPDVRALPVVCAAALTGPAARVKLMACLGAGLDRTGIAAAFRDDDA